MLGGLGKRFLSAAQVFFAPAGSGAVPEPLQEAVRDLGANVKHFGASTSASAATNTAAFNAALAAHSVVFVPGNIADTYDLNALAPLTGGRILYGKATLRFNTTGDCIAFAPPASTQNKRGRIEGLSFKNVTNVPASFIKNTGIVNLVLSDLRFSDCAATWCADNQSGYGTKFRDCVFSDVTGGGVIGRDDGGATKYSYVVTIDGCDATRISGKFVEMEGTWGLKVSNTVVESITGVAVDIGTQGSAAVHALNNSFDNVHFETNTTTDVNLRSNGATFSSNATFNNCSFVAGAGCTVALGNSSQATFIGCKTLSGTSVTVSGSATASATFIDSPYTSSGSGFVRSGTFPWRDLSQAMPLQFSWIGGAITDVLGINVNSFTGGRTALALISSSTGAGNLSASALYLIRFGYDADNFTATPITRDDGGAGAGAATYTFAVAAGGQLRITAPTAGNHRLTLLTNNFWYGN